MHEQLIIGFQADRDKILKHYQESNWIYTAILLLDPRHKLETFDVTTRSKELKKITLTKFEAIYTNYFSKLGAEKSKETKTLKSQEPDNENDFDALYEVESPSPSIPADRLFSGNHKQ